MVTARVSVTMVTATVAMTHSVYPKYSCKRISEVQQEASTSRKACNSHRLNCANIDIYIEYCDTDQKILTHLQFIIYFFFLGQKFKKKKTAKKNEKNKTKQNKTKKGKQQ